MKKVLVVIVLFVVLLTACTTTDTDYDTLGSLAVDPRCPEGISVTVVPVDRNGLESTLSIFYAFILTPNQACELPTEYCIIYTGSSKAGMSCTPVE